jgi:hypothetical protein
VQDSKYMVWKRMEMEQWLADHPSPGLPSPVPDAVVIRRQDVFAPPAFDAYSNAIQCVIEALLKLNRGAEIREEKPDRPWDYTPDEMAKRLQDIADYFHAQASIAYDSERKLPD